MNSWVALHKKQNIRTDILSGNYTQMNCDAVEVYFKRDFKFTNDQVFFANEKSLFILDGIILNSRELESVENVDTLEELVVKSYSTDTTFFRNFIGPFCGVVYDSIGQHFVAFGNQTGDAPVFYYKNEDTIIVSNDLNIIVDLMKDNDIEYHFDENAAKCIMNFGYMIDERTLISEIKRLSPGCYLSAGKNFEILRYYKMDFSEINLSFEECIEEIEKRFRVAVSRCLNKDIEYGYTSHIIDMSGGMDTRMVNWVAKSLGYDSILNTSFSQAQSDEHICASAASAALNNSFIHMQLDDSNFLYEIDELINMNYGLSVYCGITGGKKLLECINSDRYGLEHTGQLGDVVIGSYGNTSSHIPPDTNSFRYSTLLGYQVPEGLAALYENNEDFAFNVRGFRGIVSTSLIRRHFRYVVSPFLDIDFMNFCFRIPMAYRKDQQLYFAWVDKMHPMAGRIKSTRKRPMRKTSLVAFKIKRRLIIYCKRGLVKVGALRTSETKNNMNPFDYWMANNQNLCSFVEKYYQDHIGLASPYPDTLKDIVKLFDSTKAMNKMLALTVLGGLKRYFPNEEIQND